MLASADLVQGRALPDGDETVEVAERRSAGEDLDAGPTGLLGECVRLLVTALPQQPPARLGSFVDEHDVRAALGRGERGRQSGRAAADDEQIGVPAPVLGTPGPLGLRLRKLPESGGVAQHPLVHRPQPARADERLVVEAGRRERATERVGHRHHVVLEAGLGVEVLDRRTVARGLGAGADPRRAVDRHQAVRAVP